ncbi:MAG: iron-containing alcohol dehydrogenase, partial [Butyricicoccaceae bacterium]
MSSFSIRPSILLCDTVEELAQKLHIGKGDILFTSGYLYNSMIEPAGLSCEVILRDRYGCGDPNDQMIDEIRADLCGKRFNRIIAIGGGSIIDTAKVLALDEKDTTESIFCGRAHPKKICELVAVPTTCGSGAEITDLAMVQLTVKHTSVTCQMKEFLPDVAALVPELLDTLTNRNFATSSLDALVRAMEAYLSPQASPYSDLFSQKA